MSKPDYIDIDPPIKVNTNSDSQWLTISEMAKVCRVSRQTLIYYDKNDLFKPEYIDAKGYRYYSIYQIPFLREIYALKETDVPLKEIIDNLKSRNVKNTRDLLEVKKERIQDEIAELQSKLGNIEDRIAYYKYVENEMEHAYRPYVRQFPARKILFCPWGVEEMDRSVMHFTHMKLRNRLADMGLRVDRGWGAMIRKDSLLNHEPLIGGGGYVNLPPDFENTFDVPDGNYIEVPEGFFVCICRYCMPYETEYYYELYDWLVENHYTMTGDILNECMLDTTFYTEQHKKDFGQIQIPIKLPGL